MICVMHQPCDRTWHFLIKTHVCLLLVRRHACQGAESFLVRYCLASFKQRGMSQSIDGIMLSVLCPLPTTRTALYVICVCDFPVYKGNQSCLSTLHTYNTFPDVAKSRPLPQDAHNISDTSHHCGILAILLATPEVLSIMNFPVFALYVAHNQGVVSILG